MFGLDPDTVRNIKQAFAKSPAIDKVILYGSRAKGNHRNGSDIDITLIGKKTGKNLTLNNSVYPLMDELEALNLPYMFDISIFSDIDNEHLIEHINRIGKVFYQKELKNRDNANVLLKLLKLEKKKLIAENAIMDKKDNHVYPILNIPFAIPSNWIWCYLSDISIIQEGPGIRKYQYSNEGVQFLTVTNILEGYVDLNKSQKYISLDEYKRKYIHFTINKGDIVTACSGGSWGKSSIYNLDDKIILNTSTLRLRFYSDLGDNKYLYFLTKTPYFKKNLSSYSTGQQPNYGYSHYSKVPIPLPPLPEQKRIVTILDQAFTAIDKAKANTEQNLKNAREVFQSILQTIFDNGKLKIDNGEWKEKKLGEVIHKTETVNPKLNPNEEFIYLDVSSVNKETKQIGETSLLLGKDAPSRARKLIKTGDVIFATVRPTHSRVAIITEEFDNQICSTGYYVLRAKTFLKNKFIYYFILTAYYNKKMEELQKGASYPAVTSKEVEGIIIPFPNSPKEQQNIIQKLDAISTETKKLETIYQQKITDLDELKKSILQKSFTGEL